MNTPQTFTLDFGDGVQCTARLDLEAIAAAPDDRLPRLVEIVWTGERKGRHWSRYLPWAKSIWQTVADHSGKTLLAVFVSVTGRRMAFRFRPHAAPEQVA